MTETCPDCKGVRVSFVYSDDGDYQEFICHDCKKEWFR